MFSDLCHIYKSSHMLFVLRMSYDCMLDMPPVIFFLFMYTHMCCSLLINTDISINNQGEPFLAPFIAFSIRATVSCPHWMIWPMANSATATQLHGHCHQHYCQQHH